MKVVLPRQLGFSSFLRRRLLELLELRKRCCGCGDVREQHDLQEGRAGHHVLPACLRAPCGMCAGGRTVPRGAAAVTKSHRRGTEYMEQRMHSRGERASVWRGPNGRARHAAAMQQPCSSHAAGMQQTCSRHAAAYLYAACLQRGDTRITQKAKPIAWTVSHRKERCTRACVCGQHGFSNCVNQGRDQVSYQTRRKRHRNALYAKHEV